MWNSSNHILYQVQKSYNGVNWITIYSLRSKLTDTAFVYSSPSISGGYFRVKADSDISKTILITSVTPVNLHNINFKKITYK